MRGNENGRDGAAATRRPNKKRGRQWQRRPNSSVYARGMTAGFGVEDGELTRIWEASGEERGKPRKRGRRSVTQTVASPLRCRSEERARRVCVLSAQRGGGPFNLDVSPWFILVPKRHGFSVGFAPRGHHTAPPTRASSQLGVSLRLRFVGHVDVSSRPAFLSPITRQTVPSPHPSHTRGSVRSPQPKPVSILTVSCRVGPTWSTFQFVPAVSSVQETDLTCIGIGLSRGATVRMQQLALADVSVSEALKNDHLGPTGRR